jgi:DNA-binding NarL/FixJ family response regulator
MELEFCLRELGFDIAGSCATGEAAVECAARTRPDLVLMDIFLQGEMDGVDTARMIRSKLRVPVIYLTGYCDEIAVGRAKLTEPYGYLLKPYDRHALRTAIDSALDRWRLSQQRTSLTGITFNLGTDGAGKTITK